MQFAHCILFFVTFSLISSQVKSLDDPPENLQVSLVIGGATFRGETEFEPLNEVEIIGCPDGYSPVKVPNLGNATVGAGGLWDHRDNSVLICGGAQKFSYNKSNILEIKTSEDCFKWVFSSDKWINAYGYKLQIQRFQPMMKLVPMWANNIYVIGGSDMDHSGEIHDPFGKLMDLQSRIIGSFEILNHLKPAVVQLSKESSCFALITFQKEHKLFYYDLNKTKNTTELSWRKLPSEETGWVNGSSTEDRYLDRCITLGETIFFQSGYAFKFNNDEISGFYEVYNTGVNSSIPATMADLNGVPTIFGLLDAKDKNVYQPNPLHTGWEKKYEMHGFKLFPAVVPVPFETFCETFTSTPSPTPPTTTSTTSTMSTLSTTSTTSTTSTSGTVKMTSWSMFLQLFLGVITYFLWK